MSVDNLVHIVFLLVSNVNFVVECVFFLHSFAIAILLSKAFPVQLGINLSSADFILVLNLTHVCYMYVYMCMRNLYMHAQHSILVQYFTAIRYGPMDC